MPENGIPSAPLLDDGEEDKEVFTLDKATLDEIDKDGEEDEEVFTLDEATLHEIDKDRGKLVLFIEQLRSQIRLIGKNDFAKAKWSYLT